MPSAANSTRVVPAAGAPATPITGFAQCHLGILSQLESFAELPALVRAAARSRTVATRTLALFETSVHQHHAHEEDELFVAVRRSATAGAERDAVLAMTVRLTAEHRAIEALWNRLREQVKLAAAGKPVAFDEAVVKQLVGLYVVHAHFEEQDFLPLAQQILGRNGNHLQALGIALHMRRAPQAVACI
jgi:hypothetical protein